MPTGGQGGGSGGAVPKLPQVGWYKRRQPLILPIPSGTGSTSSPSLIPPPVVISPRRQSRGAVVLLTAPPSPTPTVSSGSGPSPKPQVRGWYKRRQPLILPPPSGIAATAPPAILIQRAVVSTPGRQARPAIVKITAVPAPPPVVGTPGKAILPLIVRPADQRYAGHIYKIASPAPKYTPPIVPKPLVVRSDKYVGGLVKFTAPPLKAPVASVPGKYLKPLVVRLEQRDVQGSVWIGKRLIAPPAGPTPPLIFRPVVYSQPRQEIWRPRQPTSGYFVKLPPTPTGTRHIALQLYRGPQADLPNLLVGEPSWTIDTHRLYVSDGTNQHLIGGDWSTPPAHSNSPGTAGEKAYDGTYFYFCYATNSWFRIAVGAAF